ncbi:MAG: hypothetical protein J6J83_03550 [Oscillospiraceae bacterium]|nr:hypothetical protein [Oscillospiraceae bacterium]
MKGLIFAVVFPLVYAGFAALVPKTQQEFKPVGDCFTIRYPKYIGVIGLLDIMVWLILFVVAARNLDRAYYVLLIPLAGVWLGAVLVLMGFVWQASVEGEKLSVRGVLGNTYQFRMEEIVSVRCEYKDNSSAERLIIWTETRKLVVESRASCYFLLKDKLQNELNCRVLWNF